MDPRQKVLTLAEEFKAFALKGNVVDLAVALIIGNAFTQVVNSLVANVLMPLLNTLLPTAHASYVDWAVSINGSAVPVGKFLGDLLNFLFVALALFILIRKFLTWVLSLHRYDAIKEETPSLSREQELLTEIRDLLKREQKSEQKTEPNPPPAV